MKKLKILLVILFGIYLSCETNNSRNPSNSGETILDSFPLDSCYQLELRHKGNFIQKLEFSEKEILIDKIDDTLNFTNLKYDLYQDKDSLIYIKCQEAAPGINSECDQGLIFVEYFKNFTKFININDYRLIDDIFFINDGKVFIWWVNSETKFPVEVKKADPKSFKTIEGICCGYDKEGLYYGDPSHLRISQIPIEHPEKIEFISSSSSCWNCRFHYVKIKGEIGYISFNDKKDKFELSIMKGVHPKRFKTIEGEGWDAEDDKNKYFKGEIIMAQNKSEN